MGMSVSGGSFRVPGGSFTVLGGSSSVLGAFCTVLAGSATVLSVIVVVTMLDGAVCVLVHGELRCRHTGAEYARGVHVGVAERETAERLLQLVDREAGVEQSAERHIARDSGEAIEIQDTTHSRRDSLKL
jgi:hypothetical protein